jgi:hypothetical protein
MFARLMVCLVLVVGTLGVVPAPPAAPAPCPTAAAVTTNPGVLNGTIKCLDFQRGNAIVTVGGQNEMTTVLVTPGTLIQGGLALTGLHAKPGGMLTSGYRGMTDLRAGLPVQVYTTLAGGRLTATILILQK